MNGKGSIVKMLQRRLGISKNQTASVGDSVGDISMFEESNLSINFNPWDDRPKKYADVIIEEKDLFLVSETILTQLHPESNKST